MNETQNYTTAINAVASEAINNWWQNLSKEDLLSFLRDNPYVTADTLRTMVRASGVQLSFSVAFDTTADSSSVCFFEENN